MQKRRLGNSSLQISPLVFGGNVFGWTADEAMSFRLLDGFVAAGFDCIDTADVYSKWVPGNKGGESETIIGKWLKLRGGRSKLVIATKVGIEMPGIGQGLAKDYICKRVEDSLKRLNPDYIDLYQSHCDDQSTLFEETLGAYQRLIEQGKVRAIGASNIEAPRLAAALKASAAHALPRYESLQPLYNLADRGLLKVGYYADVVVFDPATVADKATYANPDQLAVGVDDVLVNGGFAYRDGKATGAHTGRFVHGRAWTGAAGGGCRPSASDCKWKM